MNDDRRRWLRFAAEDLRMAELAGAEGLWNQVCFHAQQSVEKVLKACLTARGTAPPRTHKIADLLVLLEEEAFTEIADGLLAMDRFYLPSRYPDAVPGALDDGLPSKKEGREAIELARAAMEITAK